MEVGLRKGMIFAGCERFWVFIEGLLMTWFSGFVFGGFSGKSIGIQKSFFFRMMLFTPLLFYLISFSYRGQNQKRAPP